MDIITTRELRENMAAVIRDLKRGKAVQLSYRHRVIGTLQPSPPAPMPLRQGSPEAVRNFLETADFGPIPSKLRTDHRSFKQQVAELRKQDLQSK
ncbi:hypothetical protein HYS84_02495 [Candidatus Saccharibacteria bacterium]|nr:hypothetical protein [Candidatus Saccharibacteria bacterium]